MEDADNSPRKLAALVPPAGLLRSLGWLLSWSIIITGALACSGMVIMAAALDFVGQRNMTTAFFMYFPVWIWALPAALMVPLLLLVRWRLGLITLLLVLIFWGPWSGYQWSGQQDLRIPAEIRILSWNRGQSNGESLQPFKNLTRPDVLTMQDASGRLAGYQSAPEYAELPHAAQVGEFLILSRFPILRSAAVTFATEPTGKLQTIAGRFELQSPDGVFVVYSVHFPTPRGTLDFYKRGAFLLGVLGLPGTAWGDKRTEYQRYWNAQLALAKQLAQQVQTETLPVILAGDFNSPAIGPIHRLFKAFLRDSHLTGGTGYGYTFPGKTNNPVALFRSWLRLDWILASKQWELVSQQTETGRTSQHLAVFAAYQKTHEHERE